VKVALSHDWLNGMRGGEKCLEVLCELYPDSPIYTLFYERGKISETIAKHPIHPSALQHFPGIFSSYRYYLPLYPRLIESFRPEECDLLISTNHCVAKGLKKRKSARHLCYCFTPMRYAWGFFDEYFGKKNKVSQWMIRSVIDRMKEWDLRSNEGVDHFIAISHHIRERILKCYGREAEVVYPPVDTDFYTPDPGVQPEDFYLIVSALVPYKKIDLAVRVFNRLGRRLIIIGDGPERKLLEAQASKNIRFLGWQPQEALRDHYRRTKALIFPGEEDFGIVPVEVQSSGRFVIAYAKGGALETVLDRKTGVFFRSPDEAGLEQAVLNYETEHFLPQAARENALKFSRQRFKSEIDRSIRRFLSSAGPV